MAKRGRPPVFDQAIADEICRRLSEGESLLQICRDDRMPAESTVRSWAADAVTYPNFAANYARARDLGLDHYVDQMIEIAADKGRDPNCRRVEIDAIKWRACKLAPKKYGDRLGVEQSGPDGGPIQQSITIRFVDSPKPE